MNIEICSVHEVPAKIEHRAPDLLVSAINVGKIPDYEGNHLKLPVEDVYNVMLRSYKVAIRELLLAEGENILIHCYHGKSRSAALALIKLYQHDPAMIKPWLEANPGAEPNPLMLLFGDEILEADGDLLRLARWRYKGNSL